MGDDKSATQVLADPGCREGLEDRLSEANEGGSGVAVCAEVAVASDGDVPSDAAVAAAMVPRTVAGPRSTLRGLSAGLAVELVGTRWKAPACSGIESGIDCMRTTERRPNRAAPIPRKSATMPPAPPAAAAPPAAGAPLMAPWLKETSQRGAPKPLLGAAATLSKEDALETEHRSSSSSTQYDVTMPLPSVPIGEKGTGKEEAGALPAAPSSDADEDEGREAAEARGVDWGGSIEGGGISGHGLDPTARSPLRSAALLLLLAVLRELLLPADGGPSARGTRAGSRFAKRGIAGRTVTAMAAGGPSAATAAGVHGAGEISGWGVVGLGGTGGSRASEFAGATPDDGAAALAAVAVGTETSEAFLLTTAAARSRAPASRNSARRATNSNRKLYWRAVCMAPAPRSARILATAASGVNDGFL